ncbi:MAG: DUF1376 domain-containing protein, partial [Patescibacteria group bacterium]|nr:DUF1376 domain-containing protein [Patescibacteria group bacterium]
ERLMASELVALSSHEVVAASLFLWCRAWKQRPAASLPNDDRVIAAFARLPAAKFRRLKDEIMRGFVKCSDGRLYHKTLAVEAMRAFEKKMAFQRKRAADNERLKKWRHTHNETHDETVTETPDETRFVAEGQGQGQLRDRDVTSLPVTSQPKPSNKNIADLSGKKNGNGYGTTVKDPLQRVARFQQKLSAFIGNRGHEITVAAMNLDDPSYEECLQICRQKAVEMGAKELPWGWPAEHLGDQKAARALLKAAADKMAARAKRAPIPTEQEIP